MNWCMVLWETAAFLALFTLIVLLATAKNPAAGIHNYPPEIQEAYFKNHPRIETAPFSKRTLLIKSAALVLFSAILTGGALLAGADSFGNGFLFAVILFVAIGAYDTFFIDWVLFAKMKMFRLPGTEHMDKEYAQKWFHVKGMLFPGSLFGVIIGLITGAAVALIS
ncbi:MAG: hypothetical protein MR842_06625 [Clostridiales bacterium]|nr:hypothetical protein [Clostridiales bacterium]MDO4350001.1 hypothetical protein [Eubacteriales bacterium]MDY4010000.1 hypothetical protein [Candidatus Limiplasma sp.]